MTDRSQARRSPPDWQISSTSEEPVDLVPDGSDHAIASDEGLLEQDNEFKYGDIETPRIFVDLETVAKELQTTLQSLASEIATINQRENQDKANGSAMSFAGSLVGVAGTILAPFTFGGSLVLTTAGVAMSVRGAVVSSKAEKRIKTQIKEKMHVNTSKSKTLFDAFDNQTNEWNKVARSLNGIVKELRELFADLEVGFGAMLEVIRDPTFKEKYSYKVECFFKCVNEFYGVAQNSTHIVQNAEKITRLVTRVKSVKSKLLAHKKVRNLAKSEIFVIETGLCEPNVVSSASKQVLDAGKKAVTMITQQSEPVSRAARIVSLATHGSTRVVKTEKAVQLLGITVTKETVTVTKSVSRIGLGLGVVFAAVDLYQFRSAIKASNSRCEAEKELQSCMENIKEITDHVMSQVVVYKEVMRIKMFFEKLLEYGREMVYGESKLPLERVRSCVNNISKLHDNIK